MFQFMGDDKSYIKSNCKGPRILYSSFNSCSEAIQHLGVDVQELDVDLLFSPGIKYAPTGIGVLYGKVKC